MLFVWVMVFFSGVVMKFVMMLEFVSVYVVVMVMMVFCVCGYCRIGSEDMDFMLSMRMNVFIISVRIGW